MAKFPAQCFPMNTKNRGGSSQIRARGIQHLKEEEVSLEIFEGDHPCARANPPSAARPDRRRKVFGR